MGNRFEFEAEVRTETGTTAVRALRRKNRVPAVLYGGGGAPVSLAFDHNKLVKNLEDEAVYSSVLNVKFNGREERAIVKGLQRHPSNSRILHMDLQRVSETEKIRVNVPLHFVGESVSAGVKKGGIVTHNLVDVEISCLPAHLPEYIDVDLSGLDVGESVHLSQLLVPQGVEIPALMHGAEHDVTVATIQAARLEPLEEEIEEGEVDEASEGAEAAE